MNQSLSSSDLISEKQSLLQTIAPLLVFGTGIALAIALVVFKPVAQPKPATITPAPVVDLVYAEPQARAIMVKTQGTVMPSYDIDVVSQVSGKVSFVNDSFSEGGFFSKGDLLLQVEQQDYQFALIKAKSRVASAKQVLATEKGRARQAKREWRDLGNKEGNDLFLRKPQLASAQASLNAAIAERDKAKLDLERTQIIAPFNGRTWTTNIDQGQYIAPGKMLAKIYSTEKVEIRLPLTNQQVGLVNLDLGWQSSEDTPATKVNFSAHFGRKLHHWQGSIARTEASIDTKSRVVFAVAEVNNPFVTEEGTQQSSPMSIGLFVEAEIEGLIFKNVVELPRSALLQSNQVFILDKEQRLKLVDVEVLQTDIMYTIVKGDLPKGTAIVTSHVPYAAEGIIAKKRATTDKEGTGKAKIIDEEKKDSNS